jgi:hypothetical protein
MLHFQGGLDLAERKFNIYEWARLAVAIFILCRNRNRLVTGHTINLKRESQTIFVFRDKKTPSTPFVFELMLLKRIQSIQHDAAPGHNGPHVLRLGPNPVIRLTEECPEPFNEIVSFLRRKTLIVY